jgi:general secretion pathway protein F
MIAPHRWALRRRALPDFPLFCREVQTLLHAGMTVVEAVDTLACSAAGARTLAGALLDKLAQGQSLSVALAAQPQAPAVLLAAVRAGERTSNLPEALADYLRFDTLVRRLRHKVIGASIYPALVTALGVAISIFLIVVVMPNFARMYQNLRGASGGVTALVVHASAALNEHRWEVLLALAVLAAATGSWVMGGGPAQALRSLVQALPSLRARVRDYQLAMLYQALALLLKGGYPLPLALGLARDCALADELGRAADVALAAIVRGRVVSQALAESHLCDEVGRRLLAAAERSGQFHLAAETVSRLHGERFERFVERATRIVEPVLLMAVALLVGAIVVALYLPVFDMATRLR